MQIHFCEAHVHMNTEIGLGINQKEKKNKKIQPVTEFSRSEMLNGWWCVYSPYPVE